MYTHYEGEIASFRVQGVHAHKLLKADGHNWRYEAGRIEIARPWSTEYGLFRAARSPEENSFSLSADGQSTITLDVPRMELSTARPIRFWVGPLNGYRGTITLKLKGDWSGGDLTLKRDGSLLRKDVDYTVSGELLTIHSFSVATSHEFELVVSR